MYKVLVNEKKLSLSKTPDNNDKNIAYEDASTLEIAVDLLENTSCAGITVYGENLEDIWVNFNALYKVIIAAGGIVVNPEGNILFIHRLSKWDLPKGKAEAGETLETTAIREVEEETGITQLQLKEFINTTYHMYTERDGRKILKTTHWFLMNYNGNETPKPQVEEGIKEVSWKSKPEIEATVFPNTFENIKLILKDYWNLQN